MRPMPHDDEPLESTPAGASATEPARDSLRFRAMLVVRRFWQPTSACMTCMPGSLLNLPSLVHWEIALRTGLFTAGLALVLSLTPAIQLFRHRYGNAFVVGCLTAVGDGFSHPGHYHEGHVEALMTGVVAGVLTLVGSYLFEDRARRVRAAWRALFG